MIRNSKSWRILPQIEANAGKHMAIDEAVLTEKAKGTVPNTLRFYTWHPKAISLGYFQSVEQEIDLNNLKRYKIDLVRRITGGGAVLHDNELTYSVIISEDLVPRDIQESYKVICGAVVKGLKSFENKLEPKFKIINDIVLNGRKVSGNAQTRRNGVVLQHGTILLDVDVEEMFSVLKVPNEKIRDKIINAVEGRVTSLTRELGYNKTGEKIDINKLASSLKKGFQKTFSVYFKKSDLTKNELRDAIKLEEEKYSQKEWIYKR